MSERTHTIGLVRSPGLSTRNWSVATSLDFHRIPAHDATMQKRLRFPLAALLFAALAFVGFQVFYSKEREPMYEGKRPSAWLKASTRVVDVTPVEDMRMSEADEVVRQVGTNAIPTLLRMLRVKDSALNVRLINLAMRQHVVRITPAENWNNAAARAFWVLGTNAQSAVPALMEIASQSISPNSQYCAITALGSVGPPAKEAVRRRQTVLLCTLAKGIAPFK